MAVQTWFGRLIPSDKAYGAMFGQLGRILTEAADVLQSLEGGRSVTRQALESLETLEQRADGVTREVYSAVPRSLVHPFDPEDMYRLVRELDAVIDATEGTVKRIATYDIVELSPRLHEAMRCQSEAMVGVAALVSLLFDGDRNARAAADAQFDTVRRLERRVDTLLGEEIHDLFAAASDWREFISRKEVFSRLEKAVDHCHRSACILHEVIALNG